MNYFTINSQQKQPEYVGAPKTTVWRPVTDMGWKTTSRRLLLRDAYDEYVIGWIIEDHNSDTGFSAQGDGAYMPNVVEWMEIPQ